MNLYRYIFLIFATLALNSCRPHSSDTPNHVTNSISANAIDHSPKFSYAHGMTVVFVDLEYFGPINIYNNDRKIIRSVKNTPGSEDGIMLQLIEKRDSMFHIIAYRALMDDIIEEGWISPSDSHLSIYSSAYDHDLILYRSPYNLTDTIVSLPYTPEAFPVIDFEGEWLKISTSHNGTDYSGWIPPEEQCCNIYSTCS